MKLKVTKDEKVEALYVFNYDELERYFCHRRGKERMRTFTGWAKDGATIELEARGGPIWPCYILRRDDHKVHVYAADRWTDAYWLFIILLNLVPRDQ